ncbi:glycosyl transferase [Sporocytophaga myxococcoides]|uniref:Glycosyl transferase n=1 Tax=Sporocytophaga myxococcoides TaxID=153721 RepID=A0A098LCM1_9BACT|nr:glycosyltransferase [Sporocytophaga myxococcoides]GAL83783.1 glycosyl transferase [Sporocytophaga myxococcoides]
MVKVSVLMAAYNSAKFIGEAIESILTQSFKSFELIIVNDGSTDLTEGVIQRYLHDERIRYHKNDHNKGLVYTRNRLLELASAEYIAIMDSDDIAHQERLLRQYKYLLNNPSVGIVGSWVQPVDENGQLIGMPWCSYDNPEGVYCSLLFQNFFANSSVLMKKASIPKEGYREEYPPAEDFDLWSRMLKQTKGYNLPETLVYYRIHNDNTSLVNECLTRSNAQKVIKNQLAELGIFPDQSGLELHMAIAKFEPNEIKENRIFEIKTWLEYLYETNKVVRKYDDNAFLNVLGKYWFRVCETRKAPSLGTYFKSGILRSKYDPGFKNYFKFLIKEIKMLKWR